MNNIYALRLLLTGSLGLSISKADTIGSMIPRTFFSKYSSALPDIRYIIYLVIILILIFLSIKRDTEASWKWIQEELGLWTYI